MSDIKWDIDANAFYINEGKVRYIFARDAISHVVLDEESPRFNTKMPCVSIITMAGIARDFVFRAGDPTTRSRNAVDCYEALAEWIAGGGHD
jgi:hypothetical protein